MHCNRIPGIDHAPDRSECDLCHVRPHEVGLLLKQRRVQSFRRRRCLIWRASRNGRRLFRDMPRRGPLPLPRRNVHCPIALVIRGIFMRLRCNFARALAISRGLPEPVYPKPATPKTSPRQSSSRRAIVAEKRSAPLRRERGITVNPFRSASDRAWDARSIGGLSNGHRNLFLCVLRGRMG